MLRKVFFLLLPLLICGLASVATSKEITDPAEAQADPDFSIQGEYVGEGTTPGGKKDKVGVQVIAQGKGVFKAVIYKGGLPGAGWKRGDARFTMEGKADELKGTELVGRIADGKLTVVDADGKEKISAKRTERKSSTMGAKPPGGAVVIFDGSNLDKFEPAAGHLTEDKLLVSGVTTNPEYGSYKLHLEFRLSWMPEARGQGRSNSGIYLYDCYECQVLDSFGLEGRNNECGGFYKVKEPDVNMCLPPLVWQTYDIDLTAPKYEDGKKVANARISVKHNGVVIHDNIEFTNGTPGRKGEGPGPRGIHIQGHGNKVMYRNIWVVPE